MTGDHDHRSWLGSMLTEAADGLDVTVTGEPVYGWRDRSISAPATTRDGRAWLRVVTEHTEFTDGEFWTGNADAGDITGVAKPRFIRALEWIEGPVSVRAELMSLAAGSRCSSTPELRHRLDVPDAWWHELTGSLTALAKHATDRIAVTDEDIARRLLVFFGDAVEPRVEAWHPAHADFHWGNLMRPDLVIVDWEGWGLAPAGYDAATLYLHSLLIPETAEQVAAAFADMLNSRDGLVSQLYVTAKLLERVLGGDYPDLAAPLHRNATDVLSRLRR